MADMWVMVGMVFEWLLMANMVSEWLWMDDMLLLVHTEYFLARVADTSTPTTEEATRGTAEQTARKSDLQMGYMKVLACMSWKYWVVWSAGDQLAANMPGPGSSMRNEHHYRT